MFRKNERQSREGQMTVFIEKKEITPTRNTGCIKFRLGFYNSELSESVVLHPIRFGSKRSISFNSV